MENVSIWPGQSVLALIFKVVEVSSFLGGIFTLVVRPGSLDLVVALK